MENSIDIYHDFKKTFSFLIKDLIECPDMEDMEETNSYLVKVLEYNVPHGKLTRGLTTALSYRILSTDLCEKNVHLSYILGWCIEILHSACLVADDIMDHSETRRGHPCWYKFENNGLAAVNDIILLESTVYKILKTYFKTKPYYVDVMEIIHDTLLKTVYGQSLDTRTSNAMNFEMYNMDIYTKIVKYKTSYYSFYIPIRLAMSMAGITDDKHTETVKSLALKLGYLFQIQDDYLDCFGDSQLTGKVGRDIQDGKCTWLYVTATEMANDTQKSLLKGNYGKNEKENIDAVKKIYIELDVEQVFHALEDKLYYEISEKIEEMKIEMCWPREIFGYLVNNIYKRTK